MTIGVLSQERYRDDYIGEYVITSITIKNGKKTQHRIWIENPLIIKHKSNRATCIALSSLYKDSFYKQIENHNGGYLGKRKMQIYGVDEVWNKISPDFLITKQPEILEDTIKTGYTKKSIVYTSASNCIKYPGEFYLIPHNISTNPYALAIWLACFDGHKEVFILGYDSDNYKIMSTVLNIFKTFKDVKFTQITNNSSPHEWKKRLNFSTMTKDQYVRHCDI